MKISSIVLENFKQYYGRQELYFSIDDEKSVTVVHGENGSGKSTLLTAFRWALYGDSAVAIDQSDGAQTLINTNAKSERKSVEVQLMIYYEHNNYLLLRKSLDGVQTSSFKAFKIDEVEGNHIEIPQPVAFVASLLPKQLAEYFFFAGEGINDLSENLSGEPFVDAVRKIYGFVYLENLVVDLKKVVENLVKSITVIKGESKKLDKNFQVAETEGSNLVDLQGHVKKLKEQITEHDKRLNKVEADISKSGHNKAAKLQDEIRFLSSDVKRLDVRKKEILNRRRLLIAKYGWCIFSTDLVAKYGSIDFQTKEDSAWLKSPWDEYLLEKILSERDCLCGRPVDEHSEAEKSIISKLKGSKTSSVKDRLSDALAFSVHTKEAGKSFLPELQNVTNEDAANESELALKERQIREKEAELEVIPETDIERLNEAKKTLKIQINQENIKLGSFQRQLVVAEEEQKKVLNEAKKRENISGRLAVESNNLLKVNAVLQQAQQILSNETLNSLKEVNEQLGIFLEGQPVDMNVEVLEDFSLRITNVDGSMTPSSGESLMVNLTFVSTLISAARKRVDGESRIFASGSVAPFVIDAPFGEMDTSYSGAVVDRLVNDSSQLVLFVSSSHWSSVKSRKVLIDKIGKEYVLIKNVVSADGESGAKTISLRGKKIDQIQLGADRNSTEPLQIFSAS